MNSEKLICDNQAAVAPVCLVSACLCGVPCRYNGRAALIEPLAELVAAGRALAVCPEVDGGLPTPRPPCELKAGRALSRAGEDFTAQFINGAKLALSLAQKYSLKVAILKENSPSCGGCMVYNGNFSGQLILGEGITASLLREHGLKVFSEHTFKEAWPL